LHRPLEPLHLIPLTEHADDEDGDGSDDDNDDDNGKAAHMGLPPVHPSSRVSTSVHASGAGASSSTGNAALPRSNVSAAVGRKVAQLPGPMLLPDNGALPPVVPVKPLKSALKGAAPAGMDDHDHPVRLMHSSVGLIL